MGKHRDRTTAAQRDLRSGWGTMGAVTPNYQLRQNEEAARRFWEETTKRLGNAISQLPKDFRCPTTTPRMGLNNLRHPGIPPGKTLTVIIKNRHQPVTMLASAVAVRLFQQHPAPKKSDCDWHPSITGAEVCTANRPGRFTMRDTTHHSYRCQCRGPAE